MGPNNFSLLKKREYKYLEWQLLGNSKYLKHYAINEEVKHMLIILKDFYLG